MKLFLTKNTEYDYETVMKEGLLPDDHIVISKVVDVEFELLTDADIVSAEIGALEELARNTLAGAQVRVNAINDKIGSLLAIEDKSFTNR